MKHSLFGTRAKNFRGSHLGEFEWVLLLFWFGFIRKNRNWGKESKLTSVGCPLTPRQQVASSHLSFPKGLRMPQVFFPSKLAPEKQEGLPGEEALRCRTS